MGTYANTDPQVEAISCDILGLTPDTASTQVISRDRHADYVQTLALVAASLERFSTEIRNLQRTDVLEVEENFAKGQKGSSAMPHKRNPIRSERISGLARVIRSYTIAALENVTLWHERDISHSSTERMMLPDCSVTLHFMLREMTAVVQGLGVYPDNMRRNMNVYGGVVFSQRVLLALVSTWNESGRGLSPRPTQRPHGVEYGGRRLPRQPRKRCRCSSPSIRRCISRVFQHGGSPGESRGDLEPIGDLRAR
jgi:adenylosuccinate lyase